MAGVASQEYHRPLTLGMAAIKVALFFIICRRGLLEVSQYWDLWSGYRR